MPFSAWATPLTVLAVAIPFLFGFTQPPLGNFWPLMATGACAAALVLLALWRPRASAYGAGFGDGAVPVRAEHLAMGLVGAALVASGIGLLQYFVGDPGIVGVHPSTPGQAVGNLRQRNQQASLLSLGVWALLWLYARGRGGMIRRTDRADPFAASTRQRVRAVVATAAVCAALALMAAASAATASRTGALQWLLVLVMAWRWPAARGLAVAALGCYGLAAWALPGLLEMTSGMAVEGLFNRIASEEIDCTSRVALWSNVLHLIAQKPWVGWGWGELDYAHYVTLFPGERFCTLLDNAHNLPLHLAVELGVPVALAICSAVVVAVVRGAPWREQRPSRWLAWGIVAIVGVHSLLEFPLWYGPFQLSLGLALLLLYADPLPRWLRGPAVRASLTGCVVAVLLVGGYAGFDYYRVSQLYKAADQRAAPWRTDTAAKVSATPFFREQIDFAVLTTQGLTQSNAQQVFDAAHRLLHFSPEPRVIEPLIESAIALGRDEVAAYHLRRYRAAYPEEFARWKTRAGASAASAASASASASAPASASAQPAALAASVASGASSQ